jgi:hypothetical protein
MPPLLRSAGNSAARGGYVPVGMATIYRGFAAALAVAAVLGTGGCGSGSSASDAKVVKALQLDKQGSGYRMAGDPFCTVDEILNDSGEVSGADTKGGRDFVIASPDGKLGILVRKPFAPSCARKAKDELKRLERASKK